MKISFCLILNFNTFWKHTVYAARLTQLHFYIRWVSRCNFTFALHPFHKTWQWNNRSQHLWSVVKELINMEYRCRLWDWSEIVLLASLQKPLHCSFSRSGSIQYRVKLAVRAEQRNQNLRSTFMCCEIMRKKERNQSINQSLESAL